MPETQVSAVAADVAVLETLPRDQQELAVTSMLDQSRQWLDRALEATNPAREVAEFKAFIATVAEAAKQKKLSEAIQLDAVEMVRRSERVLGVAIRQEQEAGTILPHGVRRDRPGQGRVGTTVLTDVVTNDEWRGNGAGIKALTDGVSDEQFESALAEAKEEGNLSRANVVRKVTNLKSFRESLDDKWERIAEFADRGFAAAQIAKTFGMTEDGVKAGARQRGIDMRADRLLRGTRRIKPLEVLERTITGLEVAESVLPLVTYEGVTAEQATEWLERLESPMRSIRRMLANLKEISNEQHAG